MASKQLELIKSYNEKNKEKFNPEFFMRDENLIIEELKKIILSCQRDNIFTLKVLGFTVIDDYDQIVNTLRNYENEQNKNKKNKKENPYDFINLKDTDMKLLIVKYYIKGKDGEEILDVIIAVPRVVNKFCFRISGNLYIPMYQIVDGSTYNNATSSNSKCLAITLKTAFMPIRLFKKPIMIRTYDNKEVTCNMYVSRIFNKMFNVCKYIFGKYGFYGALKMMGVDQCISLSQSSKGEPFYSFEKYGIYINVPQSIFDADASVQSMVLAIYQCIRKDTVFEEMFTNDYWLRMLGCEFNIDTAEKGESVLVSVESIYDIKTMEDIRLPWENKKDIYQILKWMVQEFDALMAKDNLDLSMKKIRCESYIASLYATKISTGIYRVTNSNQRNGVTKDAIKKAICILPMYLISSISKCNLVNYKDIVSDLDSLIVLNATYKGIAGFGENSSNSVPESYRYVYPSHLNRLDLDASKKSDPGISISLTPFCQLYDGYFSDYKEPNQWNETFNEIVNNYKASVGLKEVLTFQQEVLGENKDKEIEAANENIKVMKSLMRPLYFAESTSTHVPVGISIDGSGILYKSIIDE